MVNCVRDCRGGEAVPEWAGFAGPRRNGANSGTPKSPTRSDRRKAGAEGNAQKIFIWRKI